jgi:hypothetical protein
VANSTFLSGGGDLYSTAEDFLQFGQMLANGGNLKRSFPTAACRISMNSTAHESTNLQLIG